jgi:hypothetical protein
MGLNPNDEQLIKWVENGNVKYSEVRDLLSADAKRQLEAKGFGSTEIARPAPLHGYFNSTPLIAEPLKKPEFYGVDLPSFADAQERRKKKAAKPKPNDCRDGFTLEFDAPIRIRSEANIGGQLQAFIRRKTAIKKMMQDVLDKLPRIVTMPCVVIFTRFGPQKFDDDNLAYAFKSIRDTLADWIGVDDGNPRYKWRYRQKQSPEHMIRVRIHCLGTPPDALSR